MYAQKNAMRLNALPLCYVLHNDPSDMPSLRQPKGKEKWRKAKWAPEFFLPWLPKTISTRLHLPWSRSESQAIDSEDVHERQWHKRYS